MKERISGVFFIILNDILGMVRDFGLSPDTLYELIVAAKKNPIPSVSLPEANEMKEENSDEQPKQIISFICL